MGYSVFGWIDLWRLADGSDESPTELKGPLESLAAELGTFEWASFTTAEVRQVGGGHMVLVLGNQNRALDTPQQLSKVLDLVARHFPASHGVIYEQDGESDLPEWENRYRVRVMRRGEWAYEPDCYLSPVIPTLAD